MKTRDKMGKKVKLPDGTKVKDVTLDDLMSIHHKHLPDEWKDPMSSGEAIKKHHLDSIKPSHHGKGAEDPYGDHVHLKDRFTIQHREHEYHVDALEKEFGALN
eukprot:gene18535-22125_t